MKDYPDPVIVSELAKKITGIYMILNQESHKAYIGQSTDIRKRLFRHSELLNEGKSKNKSLQSDWNKLGAKAFTFHILEECSTHSLSEREQFYLDTVQNQYNKSRKATPGSQNPNYMKTSIHLTVSGASKAEIDAKLKQELDAFMTAEEQHQYDLAVTYKASPALRSAFGEHRSGVFKWNATCVLTVKKRKPK